MRLVQGLDTRLTGSVQQKEGLLNVKIFKIKLVFGFSSKTIFAQALKYLKKLI